MNDAIKEFRRLVMEEGESLTAAYRATHDCSGVPAPRVRSLASQLAKTTEIPAQKRRQGRGSKPGERRGGRPPGVPNKATKEFRETVRQLLEDNADNVAKWLAQVAGGVPEVEDGKPVPGRYVVEPDPDKALQRLAQLAEYAAPKLARTEVVGDGGGPVATTNLHADMDPAKASEIYQKLVAGRRA